MKLTQILRRSCDCLSMKGDCYCLPTRLNNKHINLSVYIWHSVPYVVVKTCLISTSRAIESMQTNFNMCTARVKINYFNENWLQTSAIIIAFVSAQKMQSGLSITMAMCGTRVCVGESRAAEGRGGVRRGLWIGQQWGLSGSFKQAGFICYPFISRFTSLCPTGESSFTFLVTLHSHCLHEWQ